ncbi:hypothetical protein GYMLUDRAFT_373070, partial [Collybiopsis luxurians FD-317 M1]
MEPCCSWSQSGFQIVSFGSPLACRRNTPTSIAEALQPKFLLADQVFHLLPRHHHLLSSKDLFVNFQKLKHHLLCSGSIRSACKFAQSTPSHLSSTFLVSLDEVALEEDSWAALTFWTSTLKAILRHMHAR